MLITTSLSIFLRRSITTDLTQVKRCSLTHCSLHLVYSPRQHSTMSLLIRSVPYRNSLPPFRTESCKVIFIMFLDSNFKQKLIEIVSQKSLYINTCRIKKFKMLVYTCIPFSFKLVSSLPYKLYFCVSVLIAKSLTISMRIMAAVFKHL